MKLVAFKHLRNKDDVMRSYYRVRWNDRVPSGGFVVLARNSHGGNPNVHVVTYRSLDDLGEPVNKENGY